MARLILTTILISLSAAALSSCTSRDRRNPGWQRSEEDSLEPSTTETFTLLNEQGHPDLINGDQFSSEGPYRDESPRPITAPTPDPGQILEELMHEFTDLEHLLGATQSWDVELP